MSNDPYRRLSQDDVDVLDAAGLRDVADVARDLLPKPGWFQRQVEAARRDVDAMPAWIRRAGGR